MRRDNPAQPCPEGLSPRARELWEVEAGPKGRTQSPGRRMLLEAFLRHVDAAEDYRAVLDKEGRTVVSPKSGVLHAHPLVKVAQLEWAGAVRLAKLLHLEWEFDVDGGRW